MTSQRIKAVVTTSGGATEVRLVEPPVVGAGDVLVELEACGLCGTDLFKLAHSTEPPGVVLGHELVGRVIETGEGAKLHTGEAPETGQRIVVPHHVACGECEYCERQSETSCPSFRDNLLDPGGFAERIRVDRRAVSSAMRVLPDGLRLENAIFLEPAACVLRGIERSRLGEGYDTSAAVLGCGSMGLLHLVTLRTARPRCRVVCIDPIEERRQLALQLGADAALDPGQLQSQEPRDTFDTVFDTVGGAAPLEMALGVTRKGGSVVLFAHAGEAEGAGFELNQLFKSERSIIATYSGSLREQNQIWEWMKAGSFDASALVTHRLPLDRFQEAVDLCRRQEALKVLLCPREPSESQNA